MQTKEIRTFWPATFETDTVTPTIATIYSQTSIPAAPMSRSLRLPTLSTAHNALQEELAPYQRTDGWLNSRDRHNDVNYTSDYGNSERIRDS